MTNCIRLMSLCIKRRIIIKKRAFNLEEEALLASGISERSKIVFYLAELDRLLRPFLRQMIPPPDPVDKARALFTWLWTSKPRRYKSQGSYKLNEVIEAQLNDQAETVGNCLGLTILYNCLVKRIGILAEALYLEDAFGNRPHVLTLLQTEESLVDIENILPDGFDYRGHLNNPSRTRWGDSELVADIYHSLGNELFEKGNFIEALKNYDIAITLNAKYEKARLNKAILLDKMGKGR
jgi:tetratricopeptide (TPR) repeat protein